VESDFLGAVEQGQVRDQRVQQSRFSRASFAGDEGVLRRTVTELQQLPARCSGPAQRHGDSAPAVGSPVLPRQRRDELERHLDALGCNGRLADALQDAVDKGRLWKVVYRQWIRAEIRVVPGETLAVPR